ncbi:MAG: hypothetical protein KAT58_06470 [candidate division Zixibacteria bacterium]|nr:hypothetical protein [candidate division Zixibacteria bacterium]
MSFSGKAPLIIAAVSLSLAFLISAPSQAQQAKGEHILMKGDSIHVYVDIEDFEVLRRGSVGVKSTIKVLERVDRHGKILIAAGTLVYCTIAERSRPGMYGGAGKMVISIDSTHSTAGTKIPLKGKATFKGKTKRTIACILFFYGWNIKGKDVIFPEGKNVFRPVVRQDTPLEYLR